MSDFYDFSPWRAYRRDGTFALPERGAPSASWREKMFWWLSGTQEDTIMSCPNSERQLRALLGVTSLGGSAVAGALSFAGFKQFAHLNIEPNVAASVVLPTAVGLLVFVTSVALNRRTMGSSVFAQNLLTIAFGTMVAVGSGLPLSTHIFEYEIEAALQSEAQNPRLEGQPETDPASTESADHTSKRSENTWRRYEIVWQQRLVPVVLILLMLALLITSPSSFSVMVRTRTPRLAYFHLLDREAALLRARQVVYVSDRASEVRRSLGARIGHIADPDLQIMDVRRIRTEQNYLRAYGQRQPRSRNRNSSSNQPETTDSDQEER